MAHMPSGKEAVSGTQTVGAARSFRWDQVVGSAIRRAAAIEPVAEVVAWDSGALLPNRVVLVDSASRRRLTRRDPVRIPG